MKITNANFAKKDERFKLACEAAGVEPTKRQASKFRRGKGRAAKVTTSQINQLLIERSIA